MRDIILTLIVLGLLPAILARPAVGAYAWAWLSMMNPQKAAFGFARTFSYAYIVAVATVIGMLFSKDRKRMPFTAITIALILMLGWMTLTSFFALNDEPGVILERWTFVMKIQVMIFVTLMLLRDRVQIERLIWVITFSIGFYGIKGGAWTMWTGGGGRVWGPSGGMIEGNNELAVALIMCLPMMFYLYQTVQRTWQRTFLIISMVTCCFSILGSQSRGALLGLLGMAIFLAFKSTRPIRMVLAITALLLSAISFMPESWTGRMDTIQGYQDDTSAMSRFYAWSTMWNAAVDRPLVGAGFQADAPIIYAKYAPRDQSMAGFDGAIFVAHSIYFQMLGEHGFPGLALFVLLWVITWRTAGRLRRETIDDPDFGGWVPLLMPMMQVSLIGYAVGGAFLSLAYFDLPYYIAAYVVLVDASVADHRKAAGLAVLGADDVTTGNVASNMPPLSTARPESAG